MNKTKALSEILNGHYCYYCGKQMIDNSGWSDHEYYEEYYCDCDFAKQEIKINKEISKLRYEIQTLEFKLKSLEIKKCDKEKIYQAELKALNKKYNKGEYDYVKKD